MDMMNKAAQSKQQDVVSLTITGTQSLPVDTTTRPSEKPNASLLPREIKQCNLELESARETFLQAMDRDTEAKACMKRK
jgi:hypothetical protein